MSRLVWSKPPREQSAADRFYLSGEDRESGRKAHIYSVGSASPVLRDLTHIEATWGGMSKVFTRDDAGLEAAKAWCDRWAESAALENQRKVEDRCQ